MSALLASFTSGVALKHVTRLPNSIVMKPMTEYFLLQTNGDIWQQIVTERAMTINISLEFSQAKISLIDSRVDGLKQELENFIGVDLEDLQKEILELGEVKSSLGLRKEKLVESYNEKKVKLTTTYNSISKHIDGLCGRKEKLASEDLHGEECFYCGGRVLERTVRKAAEGIDFEIDDNTSLER